ncbi:MAG: hypothetical protein AAGH70_02405 [Pseudomonadota bacterium]
MSDGSQSQGEGKTGWTWSRLYEADEAYLAKTGTSDRTKDEYLPFLVGVLSLFLALFVAVLDEFDNVACARDSISHYYYAPFAGPYFVITLAFVSAFMFAYRGQNKWDGGITTAGSLAAILVAAFPTAGMGCGFGQSFDHRLTPLLNGKEVNGSFVADAPGDVRNILFEPITIGDQSYLIGNALSQGIHFVGAGVLIVSLIALSIIHLLRKKWIGTYSDKGGQQFRVVGPGERVFTGICVAFMLVGGALVLAQNSEIAQSFSLWMDEKLVSVRHGIFGMDNIAVPRPVYHGEWLALVGFGLAWLVQQFNYSRWLDRLPVFRTPDPAMEDERRR